MNKQPHSKPSKMLVAKIALLAIVVGALAWWMHSIASGKRSDAGAGSSVTAATGQPADTMIASVASWRHKQAKKQQRRQGAQLLDVRLGAGMTAKLNDDEAFRIYYNEELRIPTAVVYELTRKEAAAHSAQRRDEFSEDNSVAHSARPTDYLGSGYDRGHMAPAGDMKWSQAAMDRTFRMSNICPQRHDLNAGAWNDLEIRVRQWAKRDSAIIVITGPIVDKNPRKIGRNRDIAVPRAFFKVLYAPFIDKPRAIAFVMPNADNVPSRLDRYAVSIDEVERLTGLDLLYNLPDDIENAIEAQCNFSQWNRRH